MACYREQPRYFRHHPEPEIGRSLLMEALGTADPYFLDGLLRQLANVGTQGRDVDERGINFLLAVVKGGFVTFAGFTCQ